MSRQEPTTRTKVTSIPHWYDPKNDIMTVADGENVRVRDDEGREYLDFCSQLYCANLGHDNEAVIRAMDEQARRIPYVSSAKQSPVREELAGRLAEITPGRLSHTFFSVSGSEANEIAVQLAREYQDAPKVLTRWRSYHGGTYGAGSLTGDPDTRATIERHAATSGVSKFLPPLPNAFGTDDPAELARLAGEHLEFVIRNEGPESIAAILTEPVAGTSGAFPAPPGYFEHLRDLCNEYDVLLISDEVITGFGRCGDWFGIGTEGVEPDMLTFAKGITGAYSPLAGVVIGPELAEFVGREGFDLGQTFAGHPVACAAGVAAIDEYADGVVENVRDLEPVLRDGLRTIGNEHDVVNAVHGRGFLWGVEFADPDTGERFHDPRVDEGNNPVGDVIAVARERGVIFGSGRPAFQIILSPPLIADRDDLERALTVLDEAISVTFEN
ncbi:aspartate aminotransferase family protein [Halomarina halobia]|uniref:Aspartate aminotransferase family protein n=1 Tax=Halomarina halobia TaxID=3033386 RepID=A0ABD6AD66_9EURY|nr:aminotransferase class III-fold pyridoxal phosphate-dependent enzyme [Halomarina sp. PSR21]